ncbi:hypothetical protein SK128_005242 [Halocaridina rubra]|uniref:Uncharacterized protein n=1 Tax=Halocaridina rubra TaxID=373956 RepID=A0AAN8ZR19_HALRR
MQRDFTLMLIFTVCIISAKVTILDPEAIKVTENGSEIRYLLPNGKKSHVLYWSDVTDATFNVTLKYNGDIYYWKTGAMRKTSLHIRVSQTGMWLFANFFSKLISFTGVSDTDTFRIRESLENREVTFSSQDKIFWHLCSGEYSCQLIPPFVAEPEEDDTTKAGQARSFLRTGQSSRDISESSTSPTVHILAAMNGLLLMIICALIIFIYYSRRATRSGTRNGE